MFATTAKYRKLESRYLPGAYQELAGWIAWMAALAAIAGLLPLGIHQPAAFGLMPIVVGAWLGHWLLGARQIPLPRERGIVTLHDLASAIEENRQPCFRKRGIIVHRTWRELLFIVIIAIGLLAAITDIQLAATNAGHSWNISPPIGAFLLCFSLFAVLPLSYLVLQVPRRGSVIGALFMSSIVLLSGGITAVSVGEFASMPVTGKSLGSTAHSPRPRDLLGGIFQQFEN